MTTDEGATARSVVVRVAADVAAGDGDIVAEAARNAADSVPVVETGPTGIAGVEPLVLATVTGRTAFYPAPDRATVRQLVDVMEAGDLPTADAAAVVGHEEGASSLPVPDDGALSVGRRAVLGPCGWVDPLAPGAHEFVAAEDDAGAAAELGLLGRGRGDAVADHPVTEAWDLARETDGDSVVVVNANEADHRPRADRTLLAGAPLTVLDGAAAVARYVGATDVVLHLNESDATLVQHVREAVARVDLPVDPRVVAGADEHRAGAPTAALEVLEGAERIEPRLQPPTPAEHGLYGRPTVVHTPRTVAQVRHALRAPAAFTPEATDPGTRLVTITGDVAAPATVELGTDATLEAVREAVTVDGQFKLATVGGVFGGVTGDLDLPPSAPALDAAGLGTDGVVELLTEGTCVVAEAGERARFAAEANSGRCVPGREGTQQLAELLRDIYQGSFRSDDIRELARVMRRTSNCQTGAHAPRPVTTAMDEFEAEFRAHADGRCPSGICEENL